MPRRQADTKDIGYLYDADPINFTEKQRAISTPHKSWPNGHRRSRSFSRPQNRHEMCARGGSTTRGWISVDVLSLFDAACNLVFRPTRQTRCPTRANESWSAYLQNKDSLYTEELQMDDVENCLFRLLSRRKLSKFRFLARCNDINLYTLVFVYRKHFSVS